MKPPFYFTSVAKYYFNFSGVNQNELLKRHLANLQVAFGIFWAKQIKICCRRQPDKNPHFSAAINGTDTTSVSWSQIIFIDSNDWFKEKG